MLIGSAAVFLAFCGVFLSSELRNSLFFFGQYSHNFHLAYKIENGQTFYLFGFKHSWIVTLATWTCLSIGYAFVARKWKTVLAVSCAPLPTFLFMWSVRFLILKYGYEIPLEGL